MCSLITEFAVQADLVICEFAYMRSRNMDQNSLYAIFYFNLPRIYVILKKMNSFNEKFLKF